MRFLSKARLISSIALAFGGFAAMQGQAAPMAPVALSRIVQPVDDGRLVQLKGNVYPALRTATDLGMTAPDLRMDRLQLVLQRGPEQQAALDKFTAEQLDPKSPNFHHWLSPDQIGQLYGVSDGDIATITGWLRAKGFAVNSVSKGRIAIEFSGTAEQVQTAFHTEIHNYVVNGEAHVANNSDPQIPQALAPVVVGVLSLHNFFAKSQARVGQRLQQDPATGRLTPVGTATGNKLTPLGSGLGSANPQYTTSQFYEVSPYDFATIYNSLPLWNAGINGAGVSIAIAGRSNVLATDIASFQRMFGLPMNPPTIIDNGPAPASSVDKTENTLDVEWSSAAAPGARVNFVTSSSTTSTDGSTLSELYIIDNQVAPIMSASYGLCELGFGTSGNAFYSALWQQGAAEGISIFISAGDQGAAGCDNSNAATPYAAKYGVAVNGLASTPYTTAVGGTDFADYGVYSTYWNSTNAANGLSVKGYIPEAPWNDMCTNPTVGTIAGGGGLPPEEICNAFLRQNLNTFTIATVGGSGGVSACTTSDGSTVASCTGGYAKPSWQKGTGVPADGKRDLPDLSLFAADGLLGNAYVIEVNGSLEAVGGTSVASPAMAGLMALVVQKQGAAQGLANPVFYQLAANETLANCNSSSVAAGNTCVFYDISTGNISTPCGAGSPNCVVNTSDPYYDNLGVLSGYSSTTGYDPATGLGSVNATNLVNSWSTVATTPTVIVTVTPTTLPAAVVGTTYSQQLTAAGGTPPYFYSVTGGTLPPWMTLSPSGLLSGVPTGVTSYTFTISAKDSSVSGPYVGSQSYSQTVTGASASIITWAPSTLTSFTGLPLGAGVLDASSTTAGTITYTETLLNGTAVVSVTAATVLPAGSYTLTATLTSGGATVASATIPFTVLTEHVWVATAAGNTLEMDAAGNILNTIAGGGLGIAIDGGGAVWSGNTGGTSLTTFANTGVLFGNATSGGGLSTPSAIAVDGNGYIWVADSASSAVSQFSNAGVAVSPSGGYTGGNMSAPSGIAIDMSGNVWVSNAGNNSVTEILGAAAPVKPTAAAVTQNSLGVKP